MEGTPIPYNVWTSNPSVLSLIQTMQTMNVNPHNLVITITRNQTQYAITVKHNHYQKTHELHSRS